MKTLFLPSRRGGAQTGLVGAQASVSRGSMFAQLDSPHATPLHLPTFSSVHTSPHPPNSLPPLLFFPAARSVFLELLKQQVRPDVTASKKTNAQSVRSAIFSGSLVVAGWLGGWAAGRKKLGCGVLCHCQGAK